MNSSKNIAFLLTALGFSSCQKFVAVDPPIDQITGATVFLNSETATAAVMGIYTQMMPTTPVYSSGGMTIYAGMSADELVSTTPANVEENEFAQNGLQSGNGIVWSHFWSRAYRHLYQVNACLEGITRSGNISGAAKSQLQGELLFARAFIYFYLVNLFGAVPLVLGTDYQINGQLERSPASAVYAQVISDLQGSRSLLPASYASAGRVRPNKWAATALLARVYLYGKDWAGAEAMAQEVINSGTYTLANQPGQVFLANSTEAIWQLMPSEPGFNTTEARFMVPTTAATSRPQFVLSNGLINAFENGDSRRAAWVGSKTVNGLVNYYPFKYKVRNTGLPVTEYYTVLRLAEVLLIRAEARAKQDKIALAAADLNLIRRRAGLADYQAGSAAHFLHALEQERRIELMAEWGHRWLDLKRNGRASAVLQPLKPGFEDMDLLYPIPQTEINRLPALTQNPGY